VGRFEGGGACSVDDVGDALGLDRGHVRCEPGLLGTVEKDVGYRSLLH